MQLFGLRQVDSVVARAALYRDEADVAPEWVLDVDAVTETQVGSEWVLASKLMACASVLDHICNRDRTPDAAHAGRSSKGCVSASWVGLCCPIGSHIYGMTAAASLVL
jgi:hypothetical protein